MSKNKDPFSFIPSENKGIYKSVSLVVMFFDIIGFTKSTTNDEMKDCIRGIEAAILDELYEDYNWNEIDTHNDLILIPTGDGYSFAFNPLIKNNEILEIVKKFHCRVTKKINFKIRMGIAKGPCQIYRDQNDKNNVFGYGINLANRVMGLACENQILIHEDLAHEILHNSKHNEIHQIKGKSFKIKHGEEIRVYNFFGQHEGSDFGNKNDPQDPITMNQLSK
jgi:hypothetical protein